MLANSPAEYFHLFLVTDRQFYDVRAFEPCGCQAGNVQGAAFHANAAPGPGEREVAKDVGHSRINVDVLIEAKAHASEDVLCSLDLSK